MAIHTSPEFLDSYRAAGSYPCNLCSKKTYSATLKLYESRLNDASARLCVSDAAKPWVPVQDFDSFTQKFSKGKNLLSLEALRSWLGDTSSDDPLTGTRTGEQVTKKDPKVRLVFLHAADSRSPLFITKRMLVELLTYHQVMAGYIDLLLLFGLRSRPSDMRFSAFREQVSLTPAPVALHMPELGRSGRQYEICYNLKCADLKTDLKATPKPLLEWEYSLRQAAVYHRFDVEEAAALWIVTKAALDIKERIKETHGKGGRPEDHSFQTPEQCFRSSLAIHLLLAHWAGESWTGYLQWLEDVIEEVTQDALYGTREKNKAVKVFAAKDVQLVQTYSDKVSEAVVVLEANSAVLSALRNFYEGLLRNRDFELAARVGEDVSLLAGQLNNAIYDLNMQVSRAKLILQQSQARKDLILQHIQTQTAENMEAVTWSTYNVGVAAQKEAIAMRIITVVTLIYLPATFVSSFFSTDVVKYQDQGSSPPNSTSSYSGLAMNRWLQVTLPLTAVTLVVAWYAYQKARQSQKKHDLYRYVAP